MLRDFVQRPTRSQFRNCLFESLEERRVLTLVVPQPIFATVDEFASQVVAGFTQARASRIPTGTVQVVDFESEAQAREALLDVVDNYWGNLFGRQLDRRLYDQYSWRIAPALQELVTIEFEGGVSRVAQFSNESGLPLAATTEPQPARLSDLWNVQSDGFTGSPGNATEADIAEFTDEGYLFTIRDNLLRVFNLQDPSVIQLDAQMLLTENSRQLFVVDHRMIVIGHNFASVFDIQDTKAIREMVKFEFDGQIQTSRLVDGELILILQEHFVPPEPLFVPRPNLAGTPVELSGVSLGSFETREDYLRRVSEDLIAEYLPNITTWDGAGELLNSGDLGDWQDIVLGRTADFGNRASIVRVEIASATPSIRDGETILGAHSDFAYVHANHVYLANNDWTWNSATPQTSDIYQISLSGGEVDAVSAGTIAGWIQDARSMDEYQGDLRVVTRNADLYVLRPVHGDLEIVGELRGLVDGQELFSAYFAGEQALVTTAEVIDELPGVDPLHAIDLSDPTAPLELDELEIPGVTTGLRWVDDRYLIGIGFVQEGLQWREQVSLYDVSNLSKLQLVANWTSEASQLRVGFPGQSRDELGIQYEPESGILVVAQSRLNRFAKGASVFRIDPNSEEKLSFLGTIRGQEWVDRALIVGESVVSVSAEYIAVAAADRPEVLVAQFGPIRSGHNDRVRVPLGRVCDFDHLLNSSEFTGARIVSAKSDLAAAEIEISDDGRSIHYQIRDASQWVDRLSFTARTEDGRTLSASLMLDLFTPSYSRATAQLSVRAVDEDGNAIEDVAVGDRLWIELAVERTDLANDGVFQALGSVEWDPAKLAVIGAAEPVGTFANAFVAVPDENGFQKIGGISDSLSPLGEGPQTFARFHAEILEPGPLELILRPNSIFLNEVLVYGESEALHPENVQSGSLQLIVQDPSLLAAAATDVNEDGLTSALDALVIVNYLNQTPRLVRGAEGEAVTRALDVNRDGLVSVLDVLAIVNVLNADSDPAEAESPLQADTSVTHGVADLPENLAAAAALPGGETLMVDVVAGVSSHPLKRPLVR